MPQYLQKQTSASRPITGGTVLGLTASTSSPISIAPQIRQYCQVIGIVHEITADSHRVTLRFAATFGVAFVLDSSIYGKLDDPTVVLGF